MKNVVTIAIVKKFDRKTRRKTAISIEHIVMTDSDDCQQIMQQKYHFIEFKEIDDSSAMDSTDFIAAYSAYTIHHRFSIEVFWSEFYEAMTKVETTVNEPQNVIIATVKRFDKSLPFLQQKNPWMRVFFGFNAEELKKQIEDCIQLKLIDDEIDNRTKRIESFIFDCFAETEEHKFIAEAMSHESYYDHYPNAVDELHHHIEKLGQREYLQIPDNASIKLCPFSGSGRHADIPTRICSLTDDPYRLGNCRTCRVAAEWEECWG